MVIARQDISREDIFTRLPFPCFLCKGSKMVITDINRAAVKSFGYKKTFWKERALLKYVIASKGKSVTLSLQKKNSNETALITAERIPVRQGAQRYTLVLVREEKIVLHQQEFFAALDHSSLLSRADRHGRITYVNKRFEEISGYTAGELLGKDHRIFNSGYHPASFWKELYTTIYSGKPFRKEVRNKTKDGNFFWVDTFIMPFLDEHGKVTEFLVLRNDITSRKNTEAILDEPRLRMKETLEFGRMASARLNHHSKQLAPGEELLSLLQVPLTEADEMSISEFISNHICPQYLHQAERLFSNEEGQNEASLEMRTTGGKVIYTETKRIRRDSYTVYIFLDVTDKWKHLEASQQKSRLINNILFSITDGFFALDREWRFILVNPVFAALSGFTENQMLGQKLLDVFPFMETRLAYQYYQEAMYENKAATFELPPSLLPNTYDVSVYPFPEGIFVYYRDVSELRKQQKRLTESEQTLTGFFNSSSDVIVMLDAGGKVLAFNQKAKETFLELTGKEIALHESFSGMDALEDFPELMNLALEGRPSAVERSLVSRDGTVRYFNVSFAANSDGSGATTGVAVAATDITERKKAEQCLIESQQKYKELFEINPAPVFVYDPVTLRFTDANSAAISHYGYTREEFLSMSVLDIRPPEDIPRLKHSLQEAFNEKAGAIKKDRHFRHRKKDGSIIDVSVKGHRFDFDGRYLRIVVVHDITELRKTQNALQQSESMLRNLADHLPGGAIYQFVQKGDNRQYVYYSSGIKKITGFTAGEILNDENLLVSRIHPDDRARYVANKENCIRSQSIFLEEYRHQMPDGTYRWLQARSRPRKLEDGTIIFEGFLMNISQEKALRQRLMDYEHRLSLATAAAEIGVWEIDLQHGAIEWDATMRRIYGFEPHDEIDLKTLFDSIHEDDKDELNAAITGAIADKKRLDIIYRIRKKRSGEIGYVRGAGQTEYNEEGVPVRMVGVNYDLTRLKQSENAIRESEFRFRLMADSSPVFIWVTDEHNRINYISKGWYDFTGSDAGINLEMRWRSLIHPDDVHDILTGLDQALHTLSRFSYEYRLLRKEGDYRWILDSGVPRFLEDGEFIGYIGSSVDITERKTAEAALAASEARYRSIVDDQEDMMCRYGMNGKLTFVNRSFIQTFRLPAENPLDVHADELFSYKGKWVKEIFLGKQDGNRNHSKIEIEIRTGPDKTAWHEWHFVPIRDKEGKTLEIQGLGRDITYRKALETEQESLDKIVRESYNEIYLINYETLSFQYGNNSALLNTGYALDELRSLSVYDLCEESSQDYLKTLLSRLKAEEADRFQVELRHRRKNGTLYDTRSSIQVLERGKAFVIIASDITEELITEKKLLSTIKEKETLLKEIHHRVKNNLQLISSVIYLKLTSITAPDIRSFLVDTRHKIRSIALIHERLLQAEILNRIDIRDYLEKLIADIKATYQHEDIMLIIRGDFDSVTVGIDTALYCGLIVNELMTNAMKHAFTGKAEGSLRISLKHHEHSGKYILTVADNGITLPAHIEPGQSKSYGMQLLHIFIKQLHGKLEIVRNNGTEFVIRFERFGE